MKNKLYLISIMAFFILVIASVGLSEQKSGPKMFIEVNTFDAKEIKGGDYLEHSFKVYNKGDSPLEIIEVKTT
jgi:hypothetical protein